VNHVRHIFRSENFPIEISLLRHIWKEGGRCVADIRGPISWGQINFLREFNAYFDKILYSDPRVPAALYGYLCKEVEMIHAISEFENRKLFLKN
jgi:hypothetical protein